MLVLAGLTLLVVACGTALAPTPTAVPSPTPRPPVMAKNTDSWILVDLPPDATQLDHGREIYRLVCSACHAYSGEGLTDAWRATWDPQDQNCWQSKCHAANHPPDGFVLPIAPAVVGRQALAGFPTAADLRAYIQVTMPWHNPDSLTDEEGYAVTAYVIKLNRMSPPELNAQNAASFKLHPEVSQPTVAATPNAPVAARGSSIETPRFVAGSALLALCIVLVLRIRRQNRKKPAP